MDSDEKAKIVKVVSQFRDDFSKLELPFKGYIAALMTELIGVLHYAGMEKEDKKEMLMDAVNIYKWTGGINGDKK